MMLSLVDLPEELMLHIFSNSGLRTHDLYNLALVDKYISSLACPLIYRNVTLANTRNDGRRASEVFTLFEEAIEKSPERALLVRSMNITCSNRDGRKLFVTGTYSRVNKLVSKLKAIEELWLTTPDDGVRFPSNFLDENPAQSLRRIRLLYARGHMWDIARYMDLPNLEYMELKGWRERNLWPITGLNMPPVPKKTPQLRRLKLVTDGFGPSVARILDYCGALTELTCTVSSYDGHQITPATISQSLNLLGQTLTTLNLSVGAPTYVDDTGLDLSNLAALKELSVHSNMLFEKAARWNPINRREVYRRLPPVLERLKIVFPPFDAAFQAYNLAFFDENPERRSRLWSTPADPNYCNWVLEIMERKRTGVGLQSLKRFHIVEDCCPTLIETKLWDKWKYGKYDVPEAVIDAFEEAEVGFNLRFKAIRVMEDWVRPDWEIGSDAAGVQRR